MTARLRQSEPLARVLSIVALAIGLTASNLCACDVSALDQAKLIWLSQQGPSMFPVELIGAEVRCAKVGALTILHPKDAPFLYVLDGERSFHRWTQTQALFRFSAETLLSSYIQNAEFYDAGDTWRHFGKVRQDGQGRPDSSDIAKSLVWSSFKMLDGAAYQELTQRRVPRFLEAAMRVDIESAVINSLSREGLDYRSMPFAFNIESIVCTTIYVTTSIILKGKPRSVSLEVPINPSGPPFAGSARLLDRDLER